MYIDTLTKTRVIYDKEKGELRAEAYEIGHEETIESTGDFCTIHNFYVVELYKFKKESVKFWRFKFQKKVEDKVEDDLFFELRPLGRVG